MSGRPTRSKVARLRVAGYKVRLAMCYIHLSEVNQAEVDRATVGLVGVPDVDLVTVDRAYVYLITLGLVDRSNVDRAAMDIEAVSIMSFI